MSELNIDDLFGMDSEELSLTTEATFPDGVYLFELTSVRHFHQADKPSPIDYGVEGKHNIIFEWTIADESNQYYGESFQQWYTIFPGMTNEAFSSLSGPEKKIFNDNKKYLSLTAKNAGAENLKLSHLQTRVGTKRYIEVVITHKDDGSRGFVKVKSVTDPDSLNTSSSSGNGFSLV